MNCGDTFLVSEPGHQFDTHLWIVISSPQLDAGCVLIVNITSAAPYHDFTCVLRPGDHPWVLRESCVKYDGGKTISAEQAVRLLNAGLLEYREPRGDLVLKRIQEGAGLTKRIKLAHREILRRQGLIA